MATIRKFEDIIAWQKARILTREIYQMSRDGEFARDYGLRDQIRRASVSVMSNIAEGFDRESSAEFARFLSIAKGSCAEVRCQFYIALDVDYIDQAQFHHQTELSKETSRLISGFYKSIKFK